MSQEPIVRFQILAADLIEQTKFHSFSHMMRKTPAYCELVKMGKEIIPWIMQKYYWDESIVWSVLLQEITGELPLEPIKEDGFLKFDVHSTQQAWLEWYECQNA